MHGPEPPSALPPLEDTAYVRRGGPGPGGQERRADGRTARAPGAQAGVAARESASPAAPSGTQTRPTTLERSLGMPDLERGTGHRGGPRAIKKLPECPPISRKGSGWSPAPPPELGVTRHGKGYCVPGLGWEEGLRDPHLGGAPQGAGPQVLSPPPSHGGGDDLQVVGAFGGRGENQAWGGGVTGDPGGTGEGGGQRCLTRGNRPDSPTIALVVGQVAPGFRRAGKGFSLKNWAELRYPSSHPPR